MKNALGHGSEKGNRGHPALTSAQKRARQLERNPNYVRDWRRANASKVAEQTARSNIKWRIAYPERYLWHSARNSAKKRGIEFSISSDDLLPLPDRCPVFGIALTYKGAAKGKRTAASATIDRRDNSLGYVKGNVFVVSWRANQLKADATAVELTALAAYAGVE